MIGSILAPAKRAVTKQDRNVSYVRFGQQQARLIKQRRMTFNRKYLLRERPKQRRLIRGARTDFKHALAPGQHELLERARVNVRL